MPLAVGEPCWVSNCPPPLSCLSYRQMLRVEEEKEEEVNWHENSWSRACQGIELRLSVGVE